MDWEERHKSVFVCILPDHLYRKSERTDKNLETEELVVEFIIKCIIARFQATRLI